LIKATALRITVKGPNEKPGCAGGIFRTSKGLENARLKKQKGEY